MRPIDIAGLGLMVGAIFLAMAFMMGSGPAGGPPTGMYWLAGSAAGFLWSLALLQLAAKHITKRYKMGEDLVFLILIAIFVGIGFYVLSRVLK